MAKTALCVGINDYPGFVNDLSGCLNDANDWAETLERRGYGVRRLLDQAATKSAVVAALTRLVGEAAPGDSLVFTWSGHGSWLPDDDGDEADHRDETLCPHDVDRGRNLTDDELAEIFGRKPEEARLYFIADSCHSGSVSRFAPPLRPAGAPGAHERRVRFLPPGSFPRDDAHAARIRACASRPIARQKYPALLIAACSDAEYSYDDWFAGRANGAFTYTALRTLASNPSTPSEWMSLIRRALPTPEHPQTPRLFGSAEARNGPMF
jgi:hypothetical protein